MPWNAVESETMRALVILLALVMCSSAWNMATAQQSGCLPEDEGAVSLREWVEGVATGRDSLAAVDRTRFGIPGTTRRKIELVTSAAVCEAAAAAYSAAMASSPPAGRMVYVVKVGRSYVVSDPAERLGEFGRSVVFDAKWNVVVRILD